MTYQPRDIQPRRREPIVCKRRHPPLSTIGQEASRNEGQFMLTFTLALAFFGVLYFAAIMTGVQ